MWGAGPDGETNRSCDERPPDIPRPFTGSQSERPTHVTGRRGPEKLMRLSRPEMLMWLSYPEMLMWLSHLSRGPASLPRSAPACGR